MQDADPQRVPPPRANAEAADAFERIAPVTLAAPPAAALSHRVDGATVSTRTLLLGLALIALLGLGLLVGLPALIEASGPAAAPAAAVTATPAAPPATAPAAPDLATIAADETLLRARQDAQQLATDVKSRIAALEAKAVRRWAAAPFAAATAQADAAGQAFEARDFAGAVREARAALAALDGLLAEADRQQATATRAAAEALAQGDVEAAGRAVELALAIAPGDAAATRLQQRIAAFPAVQQALQQAATAEAAGDLRAATAAYRTALAADAEHPAARAALARLAGDQATARFRGTMATALAALDAGRLDEAERALKQASGLRPGDAGIADAEARLARARRTEALTRHEAEARAASAAEDWAAAARHHRAVLALDPSVAESQQGLARAESRAAIAARLDGHLAQPARLASESVRRDAEQALVEARTVAQAGPKLVAQIARLDALLAAAATPVEVRLRSDNATEVTLYKVGAQGRFAEKSLRLTPGRYVAVGSRAGHVDVRVEFTVEAGRAPAPVTVVCEEKL